MERIEKERSDAPRLVDVTYVVSKADVDVDDSEALDDWVRVLNGIAYHCVTDAYAKGWRNEIMVNMTVASCMLGIEPEDVLDDFVRTSLIDCSDDDEDPYDRMTKVLDYKRRFSWDWAIDAAWWRGLGIKAEDEETHLPVRFELVD